MKRAGRVVNLSFFNSLSAILLMLLMSSAWCAETMILHVGHTAPTFQVALPANPTTGYQWSIKNYDKGLLKLVSSRYVAHGRGLIGEGGVMEYNFKLIHGVDVPKLTAMVFTYARPWEHGGGMVQTVTVNFDSHKPVE
ncbi:MAG: protease inhibitor I42 family protein [Legionella sp.]|nr:protease inhibitor I42 family protein [Legionella sp.]